MHFKELRQGGRLTPARIQNAADDKRSMQATIVAQGDPALILTWSRLALLRLGEFNVETHKWNKK